MTSYLYSGNIGGARGLWEEVLSAIGIFDSGVGGLTVLQALKNALPGESFVYLGDTARLPYGSKSPETIRRYLSQNIGFLEDFGVKALVVACNSASSVLVEDRWDGTPIYGVIQPGARAAVNASRRGCIGVLGTHATVDSGAYVTALQECRPDLQIVQKACPLLVPLVEEGWDDDPVTTSILERYLREPLDAGVDTLILGCTHYPVLKKQIAEIAGPDIFLVDSARVIAQQLKTDLESGKIAAERGAGEINIWTTDAKKIFRDVGARILEPLHIQNWALADLDRKRDYAKF